MPWEGSSDSSASTLSQMDEHIIRDLSDDSGDVPNFPEAGGFPLARRVPIGRKESLT